MGSSDGSSVEDSDETQRSSSSSPSSSSGDGVYQGRSSSSSSSSSSSGNSSSERSHASDDNSSGFEEESSPAPRKHRSSRSSTKKLSRGGQRKSHRSGSSRLHYAPDKTALKRDLDHLGLDVEILSDFVAVQKRQQADAKKRARQMTSSRGVARGGVVLTWDKLHYKVNIKSGMPWNRKSEEKVILNDLTGLCHSGELMAVMGPSGSGKTTFLSMIAVAHRHVAGRSGAIRLNGEAVKSSFKHTAYLVEQDDALYGALTVRENLMYTADFRLPSSFSSKMKAERVNTVIRQLGLDSCADTIIGTPFKKGVSGGQRRRTSVAQGLLNSPKILLLDEPTSGLDSTSALSLIELLSKLARVQKMAIIVNIHQPSTQVYELFDRLMLLAHGHVSFFGMRADAPRYFASVGHPLPAGNPADFLLDIIDDQFDEKPANDMDLDLELDELGRTIADKERDVHEICDKFGSSDYQAGVLKEVAKIHKPKKGSKKDKKDEDQKELVDKFPRGFFYQTFILIKRNLLLYWKNPTIFWVRFVMYNCLGFMMGTLYWDTGDTQESIQDIISVLFFSVAFLSFMSIAAFPAFIEDRVIFTRERANGFYRAGTYALSHTLVQIPFVFAIAASFTLVIYWMIGLNTDEGCFWYFLLMLFFALYCAESIVVMFSAIIPYYIVGIAAGAGFYGYCMLVGGYFLKAVNMPDGWVWAPYTSFERFSFEGMMVNEFEGREIDCDTVEGPAGEMPACYFPDLNGDGVLNGTEILDAFDYEDVDKWDWLWVTLGFILFFRILFYVFIRFCNKPTI